MFVCMCVPFVVARAIRFYAMPLDSCTNLSVVINGKFEIIKPLKQQASNLNLKGSPMITRDEMQENNKNINAIAMLPELQSPHSLKRRESSENIFSIAMEDLNRSSNIKDLNRSSNKQIFVNEGEFLDSPEWIMRNTARGKKYSVSMLAIEDCTILLWPREILIDILEKDVSLQTPFMGVLGIDVSNKVFKTN